jgi:hypothetical protein
MCMQERRKIPAREHVSSILVQRAAESVRIVTWLADWLTRERPGGLSGQVGRINRGDATASPCASA